MVSQDQTIAPTIGESDWSACRDRRVVRLRDRLHHADGRAAGLLRLLVLGRRHHLAALVLACFLRCDRDPRLALAVVQATTGAVGAAALALALALVDAGALDALGLIFAVPRVSSCSAARKQGRDQRGKGRASQRLVLHRTPPSAMEQMVQPTCLSGPAEKSELLQPRVALLTPSLSGARKFLALYNGAPDHPSQRSREPFEPAAFGIAHA